MKLGDVTIRQLITALRIVCILEPSSGPWPWRIELFLQALESGLGTAADVREWVRTQRR